MMLKIYLPAGRAFYRFSSCGFYHEGNCKEATIVLLPKHDFFKVKKETERTTYAIVNKRAPQAGLLPSEDTCSLLADASRRKDRLGFGTLPPCVPRLADRTDRIVWGREPAIPRAHCIILSTP